MNNTYKYFKTELLDNLFIIRINRPETLNSLNNDLLDEFDLLLDNINDNTKVKVLIITGVGKSFVAGADIKEMMNFTEEQAKEFSLKGSKLFKKIEDYPKPIIAAINGFAIGGGCELALSCDIRLASNKAKFASPEINLGIIPGFSGTKRLANIIGIGKAKELIFTGKTISAEEALEVGLINNIYSVEDLMTEAISLANILANKSLEIISIAKESINKNIYFDIDNSIKTESNLFAECFKTGIPKVLMSRFLNEND